MRRTVSTVLLASTLTCPVAAQRLSALTAMLGSTWMYLGAALRLTALTVRLGSTWNCLGVPAHLPALIASLGSTWMCLGAALHLRALIASLGSMWTCLGAAQCLPVSSVCQASSRMPTDPVGALIALLATQPAHVLLLGPLPASSASQAAMITMAHPLQRVSSALLDTPTPTPMRSLSASIVITVTTRALAQYCASSVQRGRRTTTPMLPQRALCARLVRMRPQSQLNARTARVEGRIKTAIQLRTVKTVRTARTVRRARIHAVHASVDGWTRTPIRRHRVSDVAMVPFHRSSRQTAQHAHMGTMTTTMTLPPLAMETSTSAPLELIPTAGPFTAHHAFRAQPTWMPTRQLLAFTAVVATMQQKARLHVPHVSVASWIMTQMQARHAPNVLKAATRRRRHLSALHAPLARLIWIAMRPRLALHVLWATMRRLGLQYVSHVVLAMQTWIPMPQHRARSVHLGTSHRPPVLSATSAQLVNSTMTRTLQHRATTALLDLSRQRPRRRAPNVLQVLQRRRQQRFALCAALAILIMIQIQQVTARTVRQDDIRSRTEQ